MISKSLSTSEKRAALHQEAGKLAEFCQAIYPLLIAHADDWGRLAGDVFTVKHLIDPTSPRKLSEFERALKALHNVGLIAWYQASEADGSKWLISIRGYAAHQTLKGHDKDGRKSAHSAPPENLSNFAEVAQKCPEVPRSALTKLNSTELNLTYTVATEAATAEDAETKPDVGRFIRRFCELYSRHRHGASYFVVAAKHAPLTKRLLTVYPFEQLEKLAVVLLTADDEWIEGTDRGIGILSTKASWLAARLAEWEAKHGPVKVAS